MLLGLEMTHAQHRPIDTRHTQTQRTRFFAWSTHHGPELQPLLASARDQGVDVDIIGVGMQGDRYFFKIHSLSEALQGLPERDVVVCTDGYDVLYLQGSSAITTKFLMFETPVVFSAELWFTHQPTAWGRFYDLTAQGARYRYLNTGCIVGYAGAIRDILEVVRSYDLEAVRAERIDAGFFCDQTLVSKYLVEHQGGWALDRWCQICWCVAGEWERLLSAPSGRDGGLFNHCTQTKPPLVHVPYRERYGHILQALHERLRDRHG